MKTMLTASKTTLLLLFTFSFFGIKAQDKEIAKMEALIAKARETTDPVKKNDLYNKAAQVIMSARLPKSENIKIADAYLEDGDIANAVKFYLRCDKEDKNEGYIKVGYKAIEQGFDDPKNEEKNMRKAIGYFTKGGATAEGCEAVGDAYFEKGENYYMKAADYYAQGKVAPKIDKVANQYLSAKQPILAAEVYMKLETSEGYQKAGDLYYSSGDYNNAFTAYDKGSITDGIKKYADKLYNEGEVADANALYNRAVEMYAEKSNVSAIAAIAQAKEEKGEFGIAADFYQKAGEANKAVRSSAYHKLTQFEFDAAKAEFETLGDAEMIKAITANMKLLNALKDAENFLEQVKLNEPPIIYNEDPETGKKTPNSADVQVVQDYYKSSIGAIVEQCHKVSDNVLKLTHAGMKDAFMKMFRKYGAIRNVLDANFAKKLDKSKATTKDVKM